MAKRRRREQQHLRQESARRRDYTMGGTHRDQISKPGFPMNIMGNLKLFSLVGVVIAIVMVGAAIFSARNTNNNNPVDLPTPTATPTVDPNATPTPSPTPNTKSFPAAEQVIDATKQYQATISTSMGDIVVKLYADKAPNTVNSFAFLAGKGFYDGLIFHRVPPNFVIQAGDPTGGTGTGTAAGPGYSTADEPNQISNKRGTISMAKVSGAQEFGSQFFINVKDNLSLDYNNPSDKFYPFGEVTKGMDVVDAISKVQTDARFKPLQPITIKSIKVDEIK